MLLGSSRRLVASTFVQYPAVSSPSSFGTFPTEPTATITSFVATSRVVSWWVTVTLPGPASFAVPWITVAPAFSRAWT